MDDIDAAEDWLDSWTAGVSAQAERAAQLSRMVASLTATAVSEDRAVTVTVGSSGQIEHLELDDRAGRLRGAELAQLIMSVMRKAQARLSTQVAEAVQATVGSDTETGRAVVHSFESRFGHSTDDEPGEGARGGR